MPTRRCRVLYVISDLCGGGAERVVSTTLQHLDPTALELSLCVWRPQQEYALPEGMPVYSVRKTRWWHTPRVIWQMGRLIRRENPDVITSHLPWVNLCTGLAIRLAGWQGAWFPYCHNTVEHEAPVWLRPVYRFALAPATRVMAVSEGVRRSQRDALGLDNSKCITCYNPVDFSEIDTAVASVPRPVYDRPTVITMGRLSPEKDHAMLLQAFALVRKEVDADLVILGEGPLRGALERQARQLGIEAHVRMPGFVSPPHAHVAAADVFAFSSRHEGFGLALAEAMAVGVPAVSTRCPYGPDEIIEDGASGLLTPVGDPEALARSVLALLQDAGFAQRLAESGRRRVREMFSPQAYADTVKKLFLNAVATPASTPAVRPAGR